MTRTPQQNMQQIQDTFIETVNTGYARWQHRAGKSRSMTNLGHYGRIEYGARRKALKAILQWGYTEQQARQAVKDMLDMALLERYAD